MASPGCRRSPPRSLQALRALTHSGTPGTPVGGAKPIHRKLGASDRLTAVLRAQHAGLLPAGARVPATPSPGGIGLPERPGALGPTRRPPVDGPAGGRRGAPGGHRRGRREGSGPADEAGSRPWPAGAASLSGRERQVALLAVDGLTNREIADQLAVSVRTVEYHLGRVNRKLGITRREDIRAALTVGSIAVG
ncbi:MULTISPECIES: helix-turn-helix transcriptional regulator [Pseudofrankia]|uniref:helix-turn-helix transcriptional regulator n=1 Tax=Pseudofrankia TaxID=2994363 RepID=UPI0002DA9807|nr:MULTISPECIES: helix-turn-helix transcriptional regulator [Pseudofrankia]OHV31217.1 hypothetical protein BCD49_32330 [Pseudofrankia sp. EUN1h]